MPSVAKVAVNGKFYRTPENGGPNIECEPGSGMLRSVDAEVTGCPTPETCDITFLRDGSELRAQCQKNCTACGITVVRLTVHSRG